jgi:hypothetical protein
VGSNTSSCGTKAISLCTSRIDLTRRPLSLIVEPAEGRSLPESNSISVDLPQPDGPMIAVNSPGSTSPHASVRTVAPE